MTHDPKLTDIIAGAVCEERNHPDWPCRGMDFDVAIAEAVLRAIEAQGWVVVPREALEQAMRGFEMVQPTLERLVSGELIAVPASHPSMPIRNDNLMPSQNVSTPSNTSTSITSPDVG